MDSQRVSFVAVLRKHQCCVDAALALSGFAMGAALDEGAKVTLYCRPQMALSPMVMVP